VNPLLFLTNILASRSAEWELLLPSLRNADPAFSSLAVDLWDSDVRVEEVWETHGTVLCKYDQVLFLRTGRRSHQDRHLRPSLTYYRHFLAVLDLVDPGELPPYIAHADARFSIARPLRTSDFAPLLVRDDLFAVAQPICPDTERLVEQYAARHGVAFLEHRSDEAGVWTRGPWFTTRFFLFHRRRLARFLHGVRTWRRTPSLRLEFHLLKILTPEEFLYRPHLGGPLDLASPGAGPSLKACP